MKTREGTLYKLNPNAATLYLAISAKLVTDSTFPMKSGDKVIIEIKGDKLEVRKK